MILTSESNYPANSLNIFRQSDGGELLATSVEAELRPRRPQRDVGNEAKIQRVIRDLSVPRGKYKQADHKNYG
ncbi:MAG TPA: hypothetical protein VKA08_11430 [Balneolales bacterium]|nr:hypothetical protein [Balneolales bacterium]